VLKIDEDMALASFDLLGTVEPVIATAVSRFGRLRVNDGSTGLAVPPFKDTQIAT